MATMRQMKIALRRRMGERLQGTWGKFRYEENRPDVQTDELLETLNEAQDLVARALHARAPDDYPFLEYDLAIPIVSGQDIYTLPRNFLAVQELQYIRGLQNYPMVRRQIKSVRYFTDRVIAGGVLQYYDYQGLISTYIAEGVADQTHENILNDSLGNFSSVRVGDVVYNITDNSQGLVVSFESGRCVVDNLQGGRSNAFTSGDSYGIATAEQNRWALQTYPRITTTDRIIYSGNPYEIYLSANDVIRSAGISVLFTRLPEDLQQDEVIRFAIYEGDHLLNNRLGPSEYGKDQIRIGYNNLDRPSQLIEYTSRYSFDIQLEQNTRYLMRAFRENGEELEVHGVRFVGRTEDQMLMSWYRLPRRMPTDDAICEFPNEMNEAVYKRAKIILHEKLNNDGVSPQLYDEYDYEINEIDMSLANREESGPMEIDAETGEEVLYRGNSQWTPFYR